MKIALFTAAAIAASAAALTAMPAAAQTASTTPSWYGGLGYSAIDGDDVKLGAVGGRLGYRLNPNFGLEGEAGFGVKDDSTTASGFNVKTKLDYSAALYGVGYLPLTDRFELLARAGYGATKTEASTTGFSHTDTDNSWNYGVGAQYSFDGANGIRGDYTRHDFSSRGDADEWAVSYVRRF